ncbi:MAG: acyltransferase [Kiritimatiellae bacterium]|nr:acyltransferase [Kiritimatiellia bacterium]
MSKLDEGGIQATLSDRRRGALAKYADLVVGGGIGAVIKYELITGLFGSWPGAVGLWLRQKFYRCLFRTCGRGLIIGRNVTLRRPDRISLGRNVVLGDNSTLDAKGDTGDGIVIRDGVFVGPGTIVSTGGGSIELDEGANIGSYCRIGTLGRTRIGKKALLAAYCYVVGAGHDASRTDVPILDQPITTKGGAEVGDGCWLGARVTVMDGTKIGRDSIVGAHAVVTEDLPEFCVAVGIPAKVVKMRK